MTCVVLTSLKAVALAFCEKASIMYESSRARSQSGRDLHGSDRNIRTVLGTCSSLLTAFHKHKT